jgi:hypothetical protein
MSDIESEYSDYEDAKADEGGPHPGRSNPTRRLVLAVVISVGLLLLGVLALALISR